MEDRILIVDDEVVICNILVRRLTKEGYACTAAHNGKEALNHFYKNAFSLIISYIKMPGMTGIERLQRVKAIDPKMKMIMVTAYPEIVMAVNAMRLVAYDCIIKPADLDLIVMSVKKALESKRLEEEIEAYHNHMEELVEERTVKLKQAYRTLKKAHLDSVKVLAEAIDAKDPYTRGHSDRVTKMSLKIAAQLGFNDERLESLEYGTLLHDIGKIGIKEEVLQRDGSLR